MACGPTMLSPLCLVENKNEQLVVNQKALKILRKISQPVVVVAIVGLYRTGKSYLMNRLAGGNHGFPLGSTVQPETKGIWMWCVPHPSKPKHTLVLLDTEGLGDVEKADPKNDLWIFALAVLLSSTLVYNSMSTISNDALEKLYYVTELTELIRAKSSPRSDGIEDSTEFVSFFPDFVWTVRDFTLELKLNGYPITEDEYLENALMLIPGDNPKVKNTNTCRQCIRHFFPNRKCFVFDRPKYEKELLAHIEDVPENQLDPKFLEQSKNFCSYIFSHAKTKTLWGEVKITGNYLRTLVQTYVNAINSGAVLCVENAVNTLAQSENSAAVQKAAEHYSEQMAQRVTLPTDTLQELLDLHTACEREAIAIFMEHSFKDTNQEFHKSLVETIEEKKNNFLWRNEEASVKHCEAQLKRLSKPLVKKKSRGDFAVPGGYNLYSEEKKKVERDYRKVYRKGVKANQVLHCFQQSQAAVEESILQSDKTLTDAEKTTKAERTKKEAAEKEQELLRQQQKEQQQLKEVVERSLQEHRKQLEMKLRREVRVLQRTLEKMLEHKLKEQEQLITEGFKKEAEKLQREISELREEIKNAKEKASSTHSDIYELILSFLPLLLDIKNLWDPIKKVFSYFQGSK